MKTGYKYRIFAPRKWCFGIFLWHELNLHWVSMGSSLAIFFLINNFRRLDINCAHRREAKQRFSKNSKWKLLTPGKIENHLIPYNFNSKGDNLRLVRISNWVWSRLLGGFWINHDVILLTAINARHLWSAECRLPCAKRVLIWTTEELLCLRRKFSLKHPVSWGQIFKWCRGLRY